MFSKKKKRPVKTYNHSRRAGQQNETRLCVHVSVVYIRNEAVYRENVKGKAGRETAPNVLDLVVEKVFNITGTCGWLIEVGGSVREGDHAQLNRHRHGKIGLCYNNSIEQTQMLTRTHFKSYAYNTLSSFTKTAIRFKLSLF